MTDGRTSSYGLGISNYPINSTPVPRTFVPSNVALGNGALNLKVSQYSGSGAVQSAEVSTHDQFKYASVRTVQKSSKTPGVVEGNFFYREIPRSFNCNYWRINLDETCLVNDNQEIDWEILTSTISTSSACVPAGIWATNQVDLG